jgi:hypothetical protein
MAQTMWINIQLSAATDQSRAKHNSIGGPSGAGDATFSYDPVKLSDANTANAVLDEIRRRVIGGTGLK